MIKPGIVLIILNFDATRYSGIMIASKGIIIVDIKIVNQNPFSFASYFANPYATSVVLLVLVVGINALSGVVAKKLTKG